MIALRPVEPADIPVFYEHQADPEALALAVFPMRERAAFEAHWARIMASPTGTLRTVLADGEVAGNVVAWDGEGGREVGYWIGRAYWGRGVASAALAAFVAEHTVRPLHAWVAAGNAPSMRVLEKCGFVRVRDDGDGVAFVLAA